MTPWPVAKLLETVLPFPKRRNIRSPGPSSHDRCFCYLLVGSASELINRERHGLCQCTYCFTDTGYLTPNTNHPLMWTLWRPLAVFNLVFALIFHVLPFRLTSDFSLSFSSCFALTLDLSSCHLRTPWPSKVKFFTLVSCIKSMANCGSNKG